MKNTKELAYELIKESKVKEISISTVEDIAEANSYTIVEFSKKSNESNVKSIADKLNLHDKILSSDGFTVADDKYKLIFIRKDMTEQEKLHAIAHELGHIMCNHYDKDFCPVIGEEQEKEADDFAYNLLNPDKKIKLKFFIGKYKFLIIAIILVLIIAVSVISSVYTAQKQEELYKEYYITDTDNHYHKKGCIFVKNKTNARKITIEQYNSGRYEPCRSCLPN